MSDSEQKTVFITGVTGQCGSYLVDQYLEEGWEVIGLRRRTSTFNTERVEHIYEHPNFHMLWGDLLDSANLYRILLEHKPDVIINCAAQSHVMVSFELPEYTFEVVANGTLKLLNAYKDVCPEATFFQFSSSEMYGDNPEYPQNEDTNKTPASPYAVAKLAAHNLCRNYRKSYGLKIACGIIFNNESPRRGETFVTRKITQAAARIKLGLQDKIVLGNLDAKRDWGYSPDYMTCVREIINQEKSDDFVIATGETHTVREFLEEVFHHADLNPYEHLEIDEKYMRPHEVPCLLGDYSKAKRELGWEPKVKFKELAKIMYFSDLRDQAKKHNISLIDENHPGKEMNKFEKLLKKFDF